MHQFLTTELLKTLLVGAGCPAAPIEKLDHPTAVGLVLCLLEQEALGNYTPENKGTYADSGYYYGIKTIGATGAPAGEEPDPTVYATVAARLAEHNIGRLMQTCTILDARKDDFPPITAVAMGALFAAGSMFGLVNVNTTKGEGAEIIKDCEKSLSGARKSLAEVKTHLRKNT